MAKKKLFLCALVLSLIGATIAFDFKDAFDGAKKIVELAFAKKETSTYPGLNLKASHWDQHRDEIKRRTSPFLKPRTATKLGLQ